MLTDLTFHETLRRRLGRLSPSERLLVLADALRLLREAMPRLASPEQRLLTRQIAAALDAAGCHGEAAVLRLSMGDERPHGQRERRSRRRRWSDPLAAAICPVGNGAIRHLY